MVTSSCIDFFHLSIPPFQAAWNAVVGCDEAFASRPEELVGSGLGSGESSPNLFFFALAYALTMPMKAFQTSSPLVSVGTCVGTCVVGLFDGAVVGLLDGAAVSDFAGIVALFSFMTIWGS